MIQQGAEGIKGMAGRNKGDSVGKESWANWAWEGKIQKMINKERGLGKGLKGVNPIHFLSASLRLWTNGLLNAYTSR